LHITVAFIIVHCTIAVVLILCVHEISNWRIVPSMWKLCYGGCTAMLDIPAPSNVSARLLDSTASTLYCG